VLETLQSKLTSTMRRVLIVEDDPVQRDAVGKLLSSGDVETVGVGTAAECLELLQQQTFDCMVLDLSLPDASGFSLLETLSQDGDHAFPPVIVYTGHDLSATTSSGCAAIPARSSSRAPSRPSACSTRSRCSCTRWCPSCRPSSRR
jgi:CheY-like chemotaxis protein